MTLSELQRQFHLALHEQTRAKACGIISDHFDADQRLQIYRNNHLFSLSDALTASYPLLVALLGEECFQHIARRHILTHPPVQGDVTLYGEGLARTLALFPHVINQAPYSQSVAEFEWTLENARQLHDASPPMATLPLTHMATLPVDRHGDIAFALPHGAQLLHSDCAVFSLRRAILSEEWDNLTLDRPQSGMVFWHSGQPVCLELDADTFRLCQALQAQATLKQLPSQALPHIEGLIQLGGIRGFWLFNHSDHPLRSI